MFHGSLVALVTPMRLSGEIDYSALEKLIEWHLQNGTDGLVILGTTGEAPTIEFEEREKIMKESKPVFSTADAELIRDLILFTLKTQDDFAVPNEKKKQLEALFHRLGRFKKSS